MAPLRSAKFSKPIVVDLDGTLIYTDMLHESAIRLFKDSPFALLGLPFALFKGKAFLKRYICSQTDFDPQTLPYNDELLEWLKQKRAEGRRLILCTASDNRIADQIAVELGIFDEVISSDGILNMVGENKATALAQRFGHQGFDYAGNSHKDLPVWQRAASAIVVNGSEGLIKKTKDVAKVEKVFSKRPIGFSSWLQVLRVHQWLKNLLIFIPLFAAHDLGNCDAWEALLFAFSAFSLCASSVYIVNDLLDLENDRLHPRKRSRPLASGFIPVWLGVLIIPFLLIVSLGIAAMVGQEFLSCLILYFALTCAYSWGLKRFILIDCLTLALLYTLRIISGAVAIGHDLSFWLLAFSVFLFLSLAFVKRYAELEVQLLSGNEKIHGRGYYTVDIPLIQTMGIVAGYLSVLVLALYLNSDAVVRLYAAPELIWGAVPVMLFWVSWMWMQAHRGNMHDDPLVFAVKDKSSLGAGVICATILVAGTMGFSWLR